jgi:hypothetical protein
VRGKGSMRAEITAAFRCGRARHRRPRSRPPPDNGQGKIAGMASEANQKQIEAAGLSFILGAKNPARPLPGRAVAPRAPRTADR